jgi:HK97 family phage major capsid protein/HK97 family phage prohead protease
MAEAKRTRGLSFSSEAVVQRWYGGEKLDHSPGAARMSFINSGRAPLLRDHNTRNQVGVLDAATIDADKVGRATARFGKSAAAADALQDVDDRILTNTSVGYRIHKMVLESTSDTEGDVYRMTDWEPNEVSLVSVPADPSVGMGRNLEPAAADPDPPDKPEPITDPLPEARTPRASSFSAPAAISPKAQEAIHMTEAEKAAAAAAEAASRAEPKVGAVEAERERRDAITALCKANKIDSRVEARWIEEGTLLQGKGGVSSQILDVMEERGKLKPTAASSLGLSGNETQRYSLIRAIRSMRTNADRATIEAASFERECSAEVAKRIGREGSGSIFIPGEVLTRSMSMSPMEMEQQRAMATQPGSKGGYMVSVTNMGFIDILRNRSVAIRMGARQLSGLQGNVTFARQTGKQSVTWQGGDGSSVSAADQALGQLSMTPRTAICVTDVSEQLLRQSSPSAEQFIMADLAAVIAIDGVDNAAINGAGGAQPLGIKNTTGIASGQDASSATYAKILAFPQTAGSANAIRGNPGFVTNTAGASRLMQVQRFTSTDTPLWMPNMLEGTLVGFNAMSSEQLASGNLIFGSWDELVIGDWGVLELSTDNGGTRFNQAQVGLRALWMVDIMVRYPQAFVVGTNLS